MQKGDFVFTQGDYGDKFYIILSGSVSVLDHSEQYLKHKQEEKHKQAMKAAAIKAKRDHELFMHQLHSPKFTSPHHKGFTANILHSDKHRTTTAKRLVK